MSFNPGDKVIHISRPDLGYGVITAIYSDGRCDVKFGDATFSGLGLSYLNCAKALIEDSARSNISDCIANHDFDGARILYTTHSKDAGENWWPNFDDYLNRVRVEYEAEIRSRDQLEKSLREREKRKTMQLERQEKVINSLLDENFIEAQKKALFPDDEWHLDFGKVKLDWLKRNFAKPSTTSLSDEQLLAIGNCDNTVLLRARAGSGKTTVIKRKVDFSIRHLGLDPSQIMVLAFNKVAADQVKRDLQKDFNHLAFNNARTFHSLAYRIVQPTHELLFDINSGSNAKQSQFVEGLLEKESNPRFRKDLYKFFRGELKQMEDIGSLLTKEDYYTFRLYNY